MSETGGAVLIETSKGDIVIDLYTKDCPKTCENFLKLCKIKYYNQCAFHMVEKDFIAQCGDVGRKGGWSVWGLIDGETRRYFADELQAQRRRHNRLAHNKRGVVSMANAGSPNSNSSQFFLQLADSHIDYLDEKHTIFGHVTEGLHVLEELNNIHVSADTHQPLRKFCIHHTIVLEDPFEDPLGIQKLLRERSPTPDVDSDTEYVSSGEDEGVDEVEWNALTSAREAKSREWELVGLGDMADADLEPPKNVLFVCCINPVTEDEDLELAFSRFGKISSCEILRTKDGTSLQYCFIEFVTVKACEQAYLKMENVRIDDRRIHVDFSQSVPKVWNKWMSGGDVTGGKKGGKGGKGEKGSKGSKGVKGAKGDDREEPRERRDEGRTTERRRDSREPRERRGDDREPADRRDDNRERRDRGHDDSRGDRNDNVRERRSDRRERGDSRERPDRRGDDRRERGERRERERDSHRDRRDTRERRGERSERSERGGDRDRERRSAATSSRSRRRRSSS